MSVCFKTDSERYEIIGWKLIGNEASVTDISQLNANDEIKLNVEFRNIKIDKECVLMIRSYANGKQTGLLAQEITIFPAVMTFNLTSDAFILPENTDRIELSLCKDFQTVTPEEEKRFLIGKNIGDMTPAVLNTDTSAFEKIAETPSEKPSLYIGDYKPCQSLFYGCICFVQDSTALWIKDAKYRAKQKVIRKDNKLYIPCETAEGLFNIHTDCENNYVELQALAKQLGAFYYIDKFGLGVISPLPYDYSETKYRQHCRMMVRFLVFDRPKAATLKALFKKRIRPRCLCSDDDIRKAIKRTEEDTYAAWLSEKLIEHADSFMQQPVRKELDREGKQAAFIKAVVDYDDIAALYWAYMKKNDRRYLIRLKEHVLAMAQLENWCGEYFYLITARAMISLGMAYDLLYDEFGKEERECIAGAIVEKGFKSALTLYYGKGDEKLWPWCIRRTNWNFIPNSALIFAASVLLGEYETDMCADIIEKALQSLEYACIYLAPDGEWFEGLGYGAYSWNYFVFALGALEANFGTVFRLDESPGIMKNYRIPYALMSQSGFFSSGDSPTALKLNTAYTMYCAKIMGDHNIQCLRKHQLTQPDGAAVSFTDLIWFDDNAYDTAKMEKDSFFESTQSAVSRSGWGENDFVLYLHGGDNAMEHSHADLGNFELEMGGFRFAQETGHDGVCYCAPGSRYMAGGHDEYYSARAEGHNVFVINPDRSIGQQSSGRSNIRILSKNEEQIAYMMDLESVYRGQVKAAKRYCMLRDNRRAFVLQDEITPVRKGDKIFSFWHTPAQISFNDKRAVETNDNNVVLTAPDGRKLYLKVQANVPFILRKGMSLPLESSPAPFDQLQGGIITQLLTICCETADEPILLRITAFGEDYEYTEEELFALGE